MVRCFVSFDAEKGQNSMQLWIGDEQSVSGSEQLHIHVLHSLIPTRLHVKSVFACDSKQEIDLVDCIFIFSLSSFKFFAELEHRPVGAVHRDADEPHNSTASRKSTLGTADSSLRWQNQIYYHVWQLGDPQQWPKSSPQAHQVMSLARQESHILSLGRGEWQHSSLPVWSPVLHASVVPRTPK